MVDQQATFGAVWSRIRLPQTPHIVSAHSFDLWIWHPQQQTPTLLTQELRAELRKREWKRLPPSRLEQLFCLRGQLLPVRVMETASGELEYWAKQSDIEHVRAVPVALAFTLSGGMQVDPTTTYLTVDDPLPPTRIGEVGLVVAGTKATPYAIDVLGQEGRGIFRQLGELITELAASEALFDDLSSLPEELQILTQRLAMAYRDAHEARLRSARSLAESPHIFHATSDVPVPAAVPIQGVLSAFSNAASGARGWESRSSHFPRYTYKHGESTTKVELRPSESAQRPDQRAILSLWRKVRTFSDLDGDVFLMLLAQATSNMEAGGDPNESTWAIASRMLDYRGIQPIVKKEESQSGASIVVRKAGHRTEDIVKVAECMERLSDTWVTIRQMIEKPTKSGRGRGRSQLYTHESRLIVIDERMRQKQLLPEEDATFEDLEPVDEGSETSVVVAWHYRLGTWIEPFLTGPNRHMAWLCQQALKYNPEKELLEKRLARYFLFHLRIYAAQKKQTIVRTIQTLFHELTLPVDTRNPERTRQRFEKALNRLVQDHQLDEWAYIDENPPLPRTEWLPTWFTWRAQFSVTPPVVVESSAEYSELPSSDETRSQHL